MEWLNKLFHDVTSITYYLLRAVNYHEQDIHFFSYLLLPQSHPNTEDRDCVVDHCIVDSDVNGNLNAAGDILDLLDEMTIGGARQLGPRDIFLFNHVDHGGVEELYVGDGDWLKSDDSASTDDLLDRNQRMAAFHKIYILQPCHSGSFINELSAPNTIILASSPWDVKNQWPWMESIQEGMWGYGDRETCMSLPPADQMPKDGMASYEEAFYYSYEEWLLQPMDPVREDEYGLLDDNADQAGHYVVIFDSGGGPYSFDPAYDECTPGRDAFLAARLHL